MKTKNQLMKTLNSEKELTRLRTIGEVLIDIRDIMNKVLPVILFTQLNKQEVKKNE